VILFVQLFSQNWTTAIFCLITSPKRISKDFKNFKINVFGSFSGSPVHPIYITSLLDKLHWLSVCERISFKTLCYVYKSLHGFCPQYITDCIQIKSRPGAMPTRSSSTVMLEIPSSRKLAGDRAFSVASAQKWNKLPNSIRAARDFNSFKTVLKTHLYSQ